MPEPLKPGDVVRLKSGGASMTVTTYPHGDDGNKQNTCVWLDVEGHVQTHSFPDVCLKQN